MLQKDRLVSLRKQKKMIQQDVAQLLNISRSTYNKYETGVIQPPSDNVSWLADFFGVSTDYLLGKTDDPTPPQEKSKRPQFQADRLLGLINTVKKDDVIDLAARAGVDVMTYTHWFTGKAEPPADKVERIAEYFDVTSDYLMGLVNDPKEKAKKKEASLPSDMDEKEALRQVLIKAGIIPADRDLTPEEAKILFGAAKGVFDSFGV